jgi:hypothetical protein
MIVEHSIARHQAQRRLCISASQNIQALLAERDELLAEVNQWRAASAVPLPLREACSARQQLQDLAAVESEICGPFPNGFGDNAPEDGSGDDQYHDDAFLNMDQRHASDRAPEQDLGAFGITLPSDCFIDVNEPLGFVEQADFTDLLQQDHSGHHHAISQGFFHGSSILNDYQTIATASSLPPQSWLGSHQYLPETASTHRSV